MTNTNIQAAVGLIGPGYTYKPSGNYENGEYSNLVNAEITKDRSVRTRRAVRTVEGGTTGTPAILNWDGTGGLNSRDCRFIGELRNWTISYHRSHQVGVDINYGQSSTFWSPTSLAVNEKLVGVFEYNNTFYWITQDPWSVTQSSTKQINIYWKAAQSNPYSITFAELTKVAAVQVTGNFRSFFLHKDRLFIVTSTGIWFSKATDPLVWAVPDGGFVKWQGKSVYHAYGLNDTVYVMTNESVEVFTYSVDPNTDGSTRTIADNFPAVHGCAFRSTPFVLTRNGLYTIMNRYVEQVVAFANTGDIVPKKIVPMDDSLLIVRGADINEGSLLVPTGANSKPDSVFSNYSCYVYNVDTGSTSQLIINDRPDRADERSDIYDAYTSVYSDASTEIPAQTLFLTSKFEANIATYGDTYSSTWYRLFHERTLSPNINGLDRVATVNNGFKYVPIPHKIEIRDIEPDGSKYFKKKFRVLNIMGILPYSNFEMQLSFDSHYYTRTINLADSVRSDVPTTDEIRPPHTFKVPLNQRATAFSTMIITTSPDEFVAPLLDQYGSEYYDRGLMELLDIRYFWTYTSRPGTHRNNTSNP